MKEPVIVRVPGDKSISHRALLLASLARGESRIRGVLTGADVQSTAAALRKLGCDIPALERDAELCFRGLGLRGWRAPQDTIDCGNSGTTTRLLLGVLAAHPFRTVLTGDSSLRSRPMRRVTDPLGAAGARFEELGEPDRLPIAVTGGNLQPIRHDAPKASAQVKSALLLAGLNAGVQVQLSEPRLSRDHTERMLRAMHVSVVSLTASDGTARVSLTPGTEPAALDVTVPGDFSSAAFLLALGLAGSRPLTVQGVGLNPTRTGFLAVVRRMGGDVRIDALREEGGEPVGDVTAWPSELRGTTIAEDEIPSLIDEVPILAVLGTQVDGEIVVQGAAELRVKESDRLAVMANSLRALGCDAEEFADGIAVRGGLPVRAGRVQVHGDHRIAMAFGVLRALSGADITLDDPAVAAISFPGFWSDLRRLGEAR
jgi:3-phosphoshikimate 1-carboxyvinyltransferase